MLIWVLASILGLTLAGVCIGWLVAWWRVRGLMRHTTEVEGQRRSLPEAWWIVRRAGIDVDLKATVTGDPVQVERYLAPYQDEPVELNQVHRRAEELNDELGGLTTSTQALPMSAKVFDVAAISLGGAVAEANIETVAAMFGGGGAIAEAVVRDKAGLLAEVFPSAVDNVVSATVGNGIDAVSEPLLETIAGGVLPLPVGSVVAGGRRAYKGYKQGVHAGRIAENAALDLGVQGGGAVSGGLIGTVLIPVPVVGTAVGSAVGGLVGSMTAGALRGRHLAKARAQWLAELETYGARVGVSDFSHLVSLMDRSLKAKKEAHAGVVTAVHVRPRPWWPSYERVFAQQVLAVATLDVARTSAARDGVKDSVRLMARAPLATRALYAMTYGEPRDRSHLTPLLEAAQHFQQEHATTVALA